MLNRSGACQFVICKDRVITSVVITKIYCYEWNAHCCKEQLGFFFHTPWMFIQVLHLVTCSHKEDICVKHSDIRRFSTCNHWLHSIIWFVCDFRQWQNNKHHLSPSPQEKSEEGKIWMVGRQECGTQMAEPLLRQLPIQ